MEMNKNQRAEVAAITHSYEDKGMATQQALSIGMATVNKQMNQAANATTTQVANTGSATPEPTPPANHSNENVVSRIVHAVKNN